MKLSCPHCHKPGISPLRKMFLGPALPAVCKHCSGKMVLGSPNAWIPNLLLVLAGIAASWILRKINQNHGTPLIPLLLVIAALGILTYDILNNWPLVPPNDPSAWGSSFLSRSSQSRTNPAKVLIGVFIVFAILALIALLFLKPHINR